MLIILEDSGQLGNKLFLLSHCIASGIVYGFKVIIYTFSQYQEYFILDNKSKQNNIVIFKSRIYTRIIIQLFKVLKKIKITRLMNVFDEINTNREYVNLKLQAKALNNKNFYVLNWLYRDDFSFNKQIPF